MEVQVFKDDSLTYEELQELLYYYVDRLKEKEQEIEHLNTELNRSNNIINEFEILIKNEINESKLEEDYERVDVLEYCLVTLEEIKGSDKE